MSCPPVVPDPSITRLQEEHYDVEIKNGFLLVHNVAYVAPDCEVRRGILVKPLLPVPFGDHTMFFIGDAPCDSEGRELVHLIHSRPNTKHFEGCESQFYLSNTPKPKPGGWPGEYYKLVTHYVQMITGHAQILDPEVSLIPRSPRNLLPQDTVHVYPDDALARDNVYATAELLTDTIGIVGVGGTGSYVLDQVAKTFAKEIHLFDGKAFKPHNAYRAPGAADKEQFGSGQTKVDYYKETYSKLHKSLVPHPYFIDKNHLHELMAMGFVFVCVDEGPSRKLITDFLLEHKIPFIDVGMGMQFYGETSALSGTCRVTIGNAVNPEVTKSLLPVYEQADDIYKSNVQISEMNMLNAALAVIEWKRWAGFYPSIKNYEELLFVVEEASLHYECTRAS